MRPPSAAPGAWTAANANTYMDSVLYCVEMLLIGVGVGLISGALGLGGGILMVPAFISFIPGMDAHTAKGTSLFIIIFVALLNAWRLNRGLERKPWELAAGLAAGSICGGYAGAWITTFLSERAVLAFFMALLMGLAVRTFFLNPRIVHENDVRKGLAISVIIGVLAGIVGGATGTGGGAVLVPLALLAGLVTNERVVGLSNMVMVATALAASAAHLQAEPVFVSPWTAGHIYFYVVPLVFLGTQIGSPIGTRINAHLTLPRRRVVLGILLLVIVVRLSLRLLA